MFEDMTDVSILPLKSLTAVLEVIEKKVRNLDYPALINAQCYFLVFLT